MKNEVHLATLLVVLLSFSATAATKTWTGKISDSMCGVTHKMVKEHEQKGEISKTAGAADKERECTLACVKAGGKYVLASQGKVFEIANQDFAGLSEHAGHTVKLTGELNADGKTINVSEVTMPGKSEKAHTEHSEKKY
jgi:cytochrome c553